MITRERVTTHWEDCDDLRRAFPSLVVEEAVRWVEHERVVTSAGISAGIDMSLRLVARLASQELAGSQTVRVAGERVRDRVEPMDAAPQEVDRRLVHQRHRPMRIRDDDPVTDGAYD